MEFKQPAMEKEDVFDFFGSPRRAAQAVGISESAVKAWALLLGPKQSAQVIVAGQQVNGIKETKERWPEFYTQRTL